MLRYASGAACGGSWKANKKEDQGVHCNIAMPKVLCMKGPGMQTKRMSRACFAMLEVLFVKEHSREARLRVMVCSVMPMAMHMRVLEGKQK